MVSSNMKNDPLNVLVELRPTLEGLSSISRETRSHTKKDPLNVLVELRPSLDGFSGIPQETRLLFRTLLQVDRICASGLLQHGGKNIASGAGFDVHNPALVDSVSQADLVNTMSRVVISFSDDGNRGWGGTVLRAISGVLTKFRLRGEALLRLPTRLGYFKADQFGDFIWRTFFSKTLAIDDQALILGAKYRILPVCMGYLHRAKVSIFGLLNTKLFKKIDTEDFDVFISQTPFPGRLARKTKLIVRYHDAIPLLMPHTIKDRSFHQAAHYDALRLNVKNGAYFACVSEATRSDLLTVFPEVEARTFVIHNVVSPIYFTEDSPWSLVPDIIRARLLRPNPKKHRALGANQIDVLARLRLPVGVPPFQYLLMVSTIEPRKNHMSLLAAWEVLRSRYNSKIKLVFVGDLGWEYADLVNAALPWLEQGEFFLLSNVPSSDLRVLYKHAAATICPSYAEGFDYSGVEAMKSGGVVAASDIPVHREVYQDACRYFNPYSVESIAESILEMTSNPECEMQNAIYRAKGFAVAEKYTLDSASSKWKQLFEAIE